MRSFALWLMLVLALPGLLLPAGVFWHVCRCVSMAPAERSCCAQHTAAPAPASTHATQSTSVAGCCCERGNLPPQRDDGTSASAPCGCTWILVGDDRADPAPLPVAPPPTMPPAEHCGWLPAPAPPAPSHRAWLAAANRPPPPDTWRSLPLRL
ncbi:MAG: hypothetical protein WAT39_06740 [Planctomycetota bacterium]